MSRVPPSPFLGRRAAKAAASFVVGKKTITLHSPGLEQGKSFAERLESEYHLREQAKQKSWQNLKWKHERDGYGHRMWTSDRGNYLVIQWAEDYSIDLYVNNTLFPKGKFSSVQEAMDVAEREEAKKSLKTMSAMDSMSGGALVPPAQQASLPQDDPALQYLQLYDAVPRKAMEAAREIAQKACEELQAQYGDYLSEIIRAGLATAKPQEGSSSSVAILVALAELIGADDPKQQPQQQIDPSEIQQVGQEFVDGLMDEWQKMVDDGVAGYPGIVGGEKALNWRMVNQGRFICDAEGIPAYSHFYVFRDGNEYSVTMATRAGEMQLGTYGSLQQAQQRAGDQCEREQAKKSLPVVGGRFGKSLVVPFVKAGFTGSYEDAIGRRVCFRDGKRVACESGSFETKPEGGPRRRGQGSGIIRNLRRLVSPTGKVAAVLGIVGGVAALVRKYENVSTSIGKAARYVVKKTGLEKRELLAQIAKMTMERSQYVQEMQQSGEAIVNANIDYRDAVIEKIGGIKDTDVPYVWHAIQHSTPGLVYHAPTNATELQVAVKHAWKYKDWMDAPRPKGTSETDFEFAKRHLPQLEHLKNVTVKDIDSPVVRQHLYELAQLPEEFLKKANGSSKGTVSYYIGDADITKLDSNEHLNGKRIPAAMSVTGEPLEGHPPQQWPTNAKWNHTSVMFDKDRKIVCIGNADAQHSKSLAIHGAAHAAGIFAKPSITTTQTFFDHYKRLYPRLDPDIAKYGEDDNSGMGKQELFAESVAEYMKKGRKWCADKYDEKYVRYLEKTMGIKRK